MEDEDIALQQKKRARRRLVGATVFAALAVIILPAVMDKSPQMPVQEVEISIPDQNSAPFKPRLRALSASETKAAEEKANAELKPILATGNDKPPAVQPPAPATKASPATKPPPPKVEKPADKPANKTPEKKAAAKPAEKAAAPAAKSVTSKKPGADKPEKVTPPPTAEMSDEQRAQAILSGKAVPSTRPYVISIGAFALSSSADNLRKKLDDMGIKNFAQSIKLDGKNVTRVRAGPFADQQSAAKALSRMRDAGIGKKALITRQ